MRTIKSLVRDPQVTVLFKLVDEAATPSDDPSICESLKPESNEFSSLPSSLLLMDAANFDWGSYWHELMTWWMMALSVNDPEVFMP